MAGALTPHPDDAEGDRLATEVARRLDAIAEETERGWSGETRDGGYVFKRTLRGVTQAVILDAAMLNSSEARKLHERAESLRDVFSAPARSSAPVRSTAPSSRLSMR